MWVKSSRENEARFLYQNEVNLNDRETKRPPTSICSACICIGSLTQTKLDLHSPIVDSDYRGCDYQSWLKYSNKISKSASLGVNDF